MPCIKMLPCYVHIFVFLKYFWDLFWELMNLDTKIQTIWSFHDLVHRFTVVLNGIILTYWGNFLRLVIALWIMVLSSLTCGNRHYYQPFVSARNYSLMLLFGFYPNIRWFLHTDELKSTLLITWGGFCRCQNSLSVKLSLISRTLVCKLAILIYSDSQLYLLNPECPLGFAWVPLLVLWRGSSEW